MKVFSSSVNDDLSIKITDFSLARDVNTTNLNDKGIRSRLLVKWTALEGLAEEGQFSEKSDVVCFISFSLFEDKFGFAWLIKIRTLNLYCKHSAGSSSLALNIAQRLNP